ncbi:MULTISPECIES: ATP-binding protein [unclassified Herbaspirillum]|uniref:ATP-binding protein n=1 Tax=unclassified Herbaspirillum TaxID=2624150 RepID=UPI001172B460|nr:MULTISPECIES: ATP-binding protein [unclassified Herbaspirillum]MBB5389977.1 two-component system sensor histidine kinase BaeS [Herbaspirillum sp. SJZ102]TQK09515.1 two-component system sensor histidine kinase BaeS [Herbaspirillum sp. SJZ130]TQK13798.1 two-component system sensor histidine kinase BaeS [Herbaspirillum sp. SJZ106]
MSRFLPHPIADLTDRFFYRANIRLKLFYAMLALIVALIAAINGAGHYIFTRDFLGYLNEQAQQRMEDLIPRVEQAYRANGNWDFIRNNPRTWFELMKPAIVEHSGAAPGPTFTPSDLTGATLRFSLLDANRKLVIGYPDIGPDARLRPLMQDDAIVGWIAQTPFENVIGAVDLRFQQSQFLAQIIIAAVAIMLAAFMVIRISGVLLQPLSRVARATHRLAGGDYAIRVEVQSGDEIGRLAQDFNQLATTLERNEKLRREFMADVSHELRTPLGILNGQLEALEDGVLQPDEQTLRSLKSEVDHLNKLVDDLYDLSLADAGALAYRKADIDLAPLLRDTARNYEEGFRKRGLDIVLRLPESIPLHADGARLQQLLNNLFENSLRYTDRGGRLELRCSLQQQQWQLVLDDSAPGVEAPALARLFERFFRVEASRNRASGGAGLGLAICRRIVEAHRGVISAEASPLGGLRVTILLPAGLPAPEATA